MPRPHIKSDRQNILDSQIIYKQQVSRDVTRIETEKDSKKSVTLAFSIF